MEFMGTRRYPCEDINRLGISRLQYHVTMFIFKITSQQADIPVTPVENTVLLTVVVKQLSSQ